MCVQCSQFSVCVCVCVCVFVVYSMIFDLLICILSSPPCVFCVCMCVQAGIAGAPARAVSAVKNMNLPEMPRNINIGDISIKVPNLPSFK